MKRFLLLFSMIFSGLLFSQTQLNLIPYPQKVIINKGTSEIPNQILVREVNNDSLHLQVKVYNDFLKNDSIRFLVSNHGVPKDTFVGLEKVKSEVDGSNDGYKLEINDKRISIKYHNENGKFYAFQTLIQLIKQFSTGKKIPNLLIEDSPKFAWRGMHLDVCRHFFTVEEVKQYIDYLAMYKLNTFHWHLTDDQGWRIEIKKHPKLTQIGSKRKQSMIGAYVDDTFDGKPYGPYFYTQDQIKEVVKYATERHITVVPEIEMPGHALAALSAYPELACTKGPFESATKWGVFDDVFCPKEETFTFLQNVLDEVIQLFPSQYIHIGGDECPKTRWKECAHCQELIKKNNLKDEHGLQSYFIQRIEKYVNSKGRKIIGWDEILEGGLAPNAAVMSWTGIKGGTEAAKSGHFAVMTPGSYCYFDHYQGDPQTEPNAFGGFTPLEKVYSYNPIPSELNAEQSKYILGVQANLWTEYILDFKQVQYMIFPRLFALSEVGWGTSNPENYKEFENRVVEHFKILDKMNINYAKSIYNISGKVIPSKNGVSYELSTSQNPNGIKYAIDGSEPKSNSATYQNPIPVSQSMTIKSAYFENGVLKSAISSQDFKTSKTTGKSITLEHQPSENYSFGGAFTLVDGIIGNVKQLGKTWLGFQGKDVVATIDLGEKTQFSEVYFNTLDNKGSWIHFAKSATISISDDGKNFKTIKEIGKNEILKAKGKINLKVGNQSAKFIKIKIGNAGIIPAGNPGADSKAWLFVDEIGAQ
ncbi:glycoside hydrolase family 20 protein [Chryseobacterium indoltheticum]|uniref:beta-N-acetylhexosaminidase n=1 Tax=Chryseobacterium indoltheticum TaxID=254 RepID=A0A381FCJ2_9FLAO|nr:family 20 glycosylhydrolase [Chryseobacterium indoltheticum]AZA73896.1 beta-N-acetylhexosaminidase [Chryseobacterium indoltheticum]SIR19865.1 hexosaminidase [Chryseobacterium indoltheticum]SUX44247.1 Beta-hexosaminidase [Chryseobacterium indoltheticum]